MRLRSPSRCSSWPAGTIRACPGPRASRWPRRCVRTMSRSGGWSPKMRGMDSRKRRIGISWPPLRPSLSSSTWSENSMLSDPQDDLLRLKEILVCRSLSTSGDFTLHSGEKSTVYVDGKLTTLVPEAMPLVGRAFLQRMRERGWTPEAVGGLTLGADPIAFAIARESLETGHPVNAFAVRKGPKKHGTQKFVEGLEATEGQSVE